MVGEMWRESALISSKWLSYSHSLSTRVYLLVLCVTISATPQQQVPLGSDGVPIAAEDNFLLLNSKDGTYTFAYDTGAGDQQSFRMEVRDASGQVSGRFGYIDPDGALRITNYIADASGYRSTMTVFHKVSQKPKKPPLVVGPVPNELPSLNSIELPPDFRSMNRGRPENILPPDGTPLLIIGPLPRELQPKEVTENIFPEVVPVREDELVEVVEDNSLVSPEQNNGPPTTSSNDFFLNESNQSSQSNISLSIAETSGDSFFQKDVLIQELQSNSLFISDETNNVDLFIDLPIKSPISSSVQFDSDSLSLLNVDKRLLIDSAPQSNILISKVNNEKESKVVDIKNKEISKLNIPSAVVDEESLSIEKFHLESSISNKSVESVQLTGTELISNKFKLSSRVSGSTKLIQILRDTIVPVSKDTQDYKSSNSDVRGNCCDTIDTKKASSEQVLVNLTQPNGLLPNDGNGFLDPSNLQSNMKTSEKTPRKKYQNNISLDNMKSIILHALLLPYSKNSLINFAHLTEAPSSHQRLRSSKFLFLKSKPPKSNSLRKIFFFF